jgi:hypothetical protein
MRSGRIVADLGRPVALLARRVLSRVRSEPITQREATGGRRVVPPACDGVTTGRGLVPGPGSKVQRLGGIVTRVGRAIATIRVPGPRQAPILPPDPQGGPGQPPPPIVLTAAGRPLLPPHAVAGELGPGSPGAGRGGGSGE